MNRIYLSFLLVITMPHLSFASGEPTSPIPPTAEAAAEAPAQAASTTSYGSCQEASVKIPQSCSRNLKFDKAMAQKTKYYQKEAEAKEGSTESGAANGYSVFKPIWFEGTKAIKEAKKECEQAHNACKQLCNYEITQHGSRAFEYTQAKQPALAQNEATLKANAETYEKTCKDDYEKGMENAKIQTADFASIALMLAQLAKALGIFDKDVDSASLSSTSSDGVCDGEYEGLCIDEDGGTRGSRASASLGGSGLGGGSSVPSGLLTATEESDGGSAGIASTGSGSGSGGYGGYGGAFGASAGSGSGSGSDGEEAASELNSDIQKGYMSGGDSGGGGGGGSSASLARPSLPGLASAASTGDASAARLNRQLNRAAKQSSKRGIASKGDRNGPMEDIWNVVNTSYKNSAKTLYHQK